MMEIQHFVVHIVQLEVNKTLTKNGSIEIMHDQKYEKQIKTWKTTLLLINFSQVRPIFNWWCLWRRKIYQVQTGRY